MVEALVVLPKEPPFEDVQFAKLYPAEGLATILIPVTSPTVCGVDEGVVTVPPVLAAKATDHVFSTNLTYTLVLPVIEVVYVVFPASCLPTVQSALVYHPSTS